MTSAKLDIQNFGKGSALKQGKTLQEMGVYIQEMVCSLPEVHRLIHSEDEHFDLLVLETFFLQESFSAFQHKFNAPAVELMTLGINLTC